MFPKVNVPQFDAKDGAAIIQLTRCKRVLGYLSEVGLVFVGSNLVNSRVSVCSNNTSDRIRRTAAS